MNKALYTALENRLKDSELGIKTIDLFNNQLNTEKEVVFFPCVLIAYDATYENLSQGVQKALVRLIFYLAIDITGLSSKKGSKNQATALAVFDLKDNLNQCLQGFSEDFFTPLVRISEIQDTDFKNIQVFQMTYETEFTDISSWVGNQFLEVQGLTLELTKDIEIQNFKLRT